MALRIARTGPRAVITSALSQTNTRLPGSPWAERLISRPAYPVESAVGRAAAEVNGHWKATRSG